MPTSNEWRLLSGLRTHNSPSWISTRPSYPNPRSTHHPRWRWPRERADSMTTFDTLGASEVGNNVGVEVAFVASHAPQIFLGRGDPPETLAIIHAAMARMGRRIQEAKLDALIVIALD